MTLFAIFAVPCLTLCLSYLNSSTAVRKQVARGTLAIQFLKGFILGIPGLVVVLLLRRFLPLSYRFFPLFLHILAVDHLVPAGFLVGMYFLFCAQKGLKELLLFGGGFYSLLGLVYVFTAYGCYEPYLLFLLPLLRMATLLFLTLFFLRFQNWYGVVRVLFASLLAIVPVLGGTVSSLYARFYTAWAVAIAVLFFLGSLAYLIIEGES